MASIPNNKEWTDFFEAYKNLPSLWKVTSKNYQNNKANKKKKLRDYELLLTEYRKIDAGANIKILQNKLHNLRFCYRRELKKMVTCGATSLITAADDLYEPNLWYFNRLDFLRDQMMVEINKSTQISNGIRPKDEILNIPYTPNDLVQPKIVGDSYQEEDEDMEEGGIIIKHELETTNLNGSTLGLEMLQAQSINVFDNMLESTQQQESLKDDIEIYAVNWAVQFRNMMPEQKIFAKKAIEDVLCLGQLEQLTLNSVQIPSQNLTDSFGHSESVNDIPQLYNAAVNEIGQNNEQQTFQDQNWSTME